MSDNKNLQNGNINVNLDTTGGDPAQDAQGKAPEDTQGDNVDFSSVIEAQNKTIKQQQETIASMLEQVNSLNAQMADYIRSVGSPAPEGATPDDAANPANAIPEDYVYLKDLGKEIGKR